MQEEKAPVKTLRRVLGVVVVTLMLLLGSLAPFGQDEPTAPPPTPTAGASR